MRSPTGRPSRRGFTLFEVATSLLLVTVTVLATLTLLPVGAQAQQMSRYQLYAAAKANELIDAFSQSGLDLRGFSSSRWELPFVTYMDEATPSGDALQRRIIYGSVGQYDLERVVVNAGNGNFVVPTEIARRLDSPGDRLRAVLDQGGAIYASEPYGARGFSHGETYSGAKRGTVPELQRLVWAVTSPAQLNALPAHPMAPVPRELWPFPPQGRGATVVRRHGRDELWQYDSKGKLQTVESVIKRLMAMDASRSAGLYQGNNWEWLAETEIPESGKRNRWADSIAEFRRLVNCHWLRLYHQLGPVPGSPQLWRISAPYKGAPKWNPKDSVDKDGKDVGAFEDENGLNFEDDPNRIGAESVIGCPAPAMGLPFGRHRGTDIMNEDHETSRLRLTEQVRYGLPSLERRVMYRTAALALWARVQGPDSTGAEPISIHSSPADNLAGSTTDPNVADMVSALGGRNPLLQVVPPPSNPKDIHPAQVLALSYLAHAAMMVTGYQPPFVDDKRTVDATDDIDLVPDESVPYKALYKQEHWLREPFVSDARDEEIYPVDTTVLDGPTLARLQKDISGNPIKYQRFVGPVLNPHPAPYADRGAFDVGGARTYTTEDRDVTAYDHSYEVDEAQRRLATEHGDDNPDIDGDGQGDDLGKDGMLNYHLAVEGIHRVVTGYAGGQGNDTRWAHNAYETMVAWAMAYLRENPYDLLVPRPLNQQTMMDRTLYAWDLFDADGKALRTRAEPPGHYTVAWGSRHAAFGAQWAQPYTIDSPGAYRNAFGSAPPQAYIFAAPDDRIAEGQTWNTPRTFARGLAALHGASIESKDGKSLWNHAESPRRDHYRLNDAFTVADRCRELVFWSVDWKSYADAESVPSAPVDLSRMSRKPDGHAVGPWWMHKSGWLGNPEQFVAWTNSARNRTAASDPAVWDNVRGWVGAFTMHAGLGRWGADRNGNGIFDVGPVPPTTRLRATEVARFVFYDPVAWTSLRN
ncbi:MAG TPA: hypothetical protein VEL07_05125 [Planctomycetota bacterium]|nr:hypothetical protein [Planctomycetota bacterium]